MKCLAQGHNTALWASNMGPLSHKSGNLSTEFVFVWCFFLIINYLGRVVRKPAFGISN